MLTGTGLFSSMYLTYKYPIEFLSGKHQKSKAENGRFECGFNAAIGAFLQALLMILQHKIAITWNETSKITNQ